MKTLYAISGVTGMTGNELVRQILSDPAKEDVVLGFDNFYASSIDTVSDCLGDKRFAFFEYDDDSFNFSEIKDNKIEIRKKEDLDTLLGWMQKIIDTQSRQIDILSQIVMQYQQEKKQF